ncbi:MAG TPA: T9SS type A sorting domain-containing protein [Chitinophaga sp.]|uniref:Ig-like domain-containing protein n=1 Tax=Chitinophaga sp. TaxID=1869181 RepID=UPI002B7A2E5E|nr:T9SS type A sorting domain-containing protein [Chitinophaga sp.]HVI45117.1 T9SS type A sorting domain-containing protein [Chitinophaga sp.]
MKKIYPLFVSMLILWLQILLPEALSAQRIYANTQLNGVTGLCLFCGVQNPDNPVNTASLNDYSTFNITVGLLGVSVYETLIFPSQSSNCDSLVIGIGSGNTILSADLFGGVTVETFNGTVANNDARVISSDVLRLLQSNTRAEVLLHPGKPYDRVKITLNSSLVGLLNNFHLYYAYRNPGIPANPAFKVPEYFVCNDPRIPITNHTAGYNYNVRLRYTDVFNTVIKDTSFILINKDTVLVKNQGTYASSQADVYMQAVNPFTGCASNTVQKTFAFGGIAILPQVDDTNVTICLGTSATLHAFVSFSSVPAVRWYDAPTGGNLLHTGNYFTVSPAHNTTYYVTTSLACEYPLRVPVNVYVTKLADPDITAPAGTLCTDAILPVSNHQPGLNYRVQVKFTMEVGAPFDTSFTVINNNTIIVKSPHSYSAALATACVQAINPVTNCVSDTVSAFFLFGGASALPKVDSDSVAVCRRDSVTLHGYIPFSTIPQIRWYDTPTGGTLLHTGPYFRVSPGVTTTYYVTSGSFCEYPQRVPVKVVVLDCPQAQADQHMYPVSTGTQQLALQVYPNPTSGMVRIITSGWEGALIRVYDLSGKLMQQEILRQNSLMLSANTGYYIIRMITTKGKTYSSKVWLQR